MRRSIGCVLILMGAMVITEDVVAETANTSPLASLVGNPSDRSSPPPLNLGAQSVDVHSSWFKPVLTENSDSACESLLEDVRQKFFSDSSFNEAYGVRGHGYLKTGEILDWEVDSGLGRGEITAYGKTYYLDYMRHPGCGGACETNQPLVSDKPFPEQSDYAYRDTLATEAPPADSYEYTIARRSADDVYLLVVETTGRRISIYRLAREGRWQPACKVATAPEHMTEAMPVKSDKVVDSLQALQQKVFGLMRGAGDCGSMATHWRWQGDVGNAMQTVLYRPWVLREREPGPDADGSYENDMRNLEQWSLLGSSDYKALQDFKAQLIDTTKQLAAFYQKANGWSQEFSTSMALDTLKGAVSNGVRFYMYDPHFAEGEEAMRQAILEKRKMGDIRAIKFDAQSVDAQENGWGEDPGSHESILSIAVDYPEALGFLLQSAVPNDHANDFGKTPLMYAVQSNQVNGAKLLIKAGADVNAVTTKPSNTCYYTLRTFNVTPLHYAVRNASAEMIKLLLNSGAQPFIKANSQMVEESPLDWLHRYTASDAAEKNPNIPDEQVGEIAKWLAPLTGKQAEETASAYVLKAENSYQQGDVVNAYRDISLAAQLQPDNQRTLSDLSLIALKNSKLGESLSASKTLINSQADDKIKANAWFNQGLACEKHREQNQNGSLAFNGDMYCTYGVLHSYVKAYQLTPTDGRKNKLKILFDEHLVPYCAIPVLGKNIKINFQAGSNPAPGIRGQQLQTLYVLHDKNQIVTGADLAWDAWFNKGEKRRVVPEKTVSFDLGDRVVSVFETSVTFVQFPYKVFGTTCTQNESTKLPIND